MSNIAELIGTGTASEKTNAITYLRETVVKDLPDDGTHPSDLVFEKVTVRLDKAAMVVPVSQEMFQDVPAMRAYVNHASGRMFRHSLGGLIVKAIEEAGARRFRTRPWETNRRAIQRAQRRVEKKGLIETEVVTESRSKTIVGAFREGATLWTKGEVQVETSNMRTSSSETSSRCASSSPSR
jgi:hypothetical protein